MKKIKIIIAYISSYRHWLISLITVDILFILLAWFAYPESFSSLVWLMIFISLAAFILPLIVLVKNHMKKEKAFQHFLLEPDEANEYLLCELFASSIHPYIHEIGQRLREYQAKMDERTVQITDYENYIESWIHEIKKPLSLMTLVLDNRKDEISPLVLSKMLHARNKIHGDVEQILYFSRLGAAHKDYYFEPLSLLSICKEAVDDNLWLLNESGFTVGFSGADREVVSDKKGLMFILGQIISNSVKYVNKQYPLIRFDISNRKSAEEIVLCISDNGKGICESDLPFIFNKGFTGNNGTYLSRSTGMGLFLVQKMARDLAIELKVESSPGSGMTLSLIFPKVEYFLGEQ